MKNTFVAVLIGAVIVTVQAAQSTNCMNCKKLDSSSSFLYSWSYCKWTDECLADVWNYMNAFCPSTWIQGWMIDIDADCEATEAIGVCDPFVSSKDKYGEYSNVTKSLPPAAKCSVNIDASAALARVVFDDTQNLGVLFNGYVIGQPITIPEGEIQEITIYNGNIAQPVAFVLSYSGAKQLAASIITFASSLALFTN